MGWNKQKARDREQLTANTSHRLKQSKEYHTGVTISTDETEGYPRNPKRRKTNALPLPTTATGHILARDYQCKTYNTGGHSLNAHRSRTPSPLSHHYTPQTRDDTSSQIHSRHYKKRTEASSLANARRCKKGKKTKGHSNHRDGIDI